ncbi:MAG: hypothetical protein CMO74_01315 [Verrucomicrobiales bacterium]|nr:hypothetical protein [Verrucomicrobiales bacterium]|tara:strand:+ start:20 stop:1012 length:993 start_codon:yes stop_codon:yes gene_type:complete
MADASKTTLHARPALERIMRIHQAVLNGEHPTATGLARELEVDRRTITRDITFMRDRWELPLEYNPSRGGFVYTRPVDAMPGAVITEGELFSVLIAEKSLQQYRGTVFERQLKRAFGKIADMMPESVTINLDDWGQSVTFRNTGIPKQDIDTFDILARGVTQQRQLEISYRKPRVKKAEKRIVDPHHLACIDGEWYLFAFDHKRRDMRVFKPTRMKEVSMTGETFERRKSFSLEKYLSGAFGVFTGSQLFDVVIRFSPDVADYIREKEWHESQNLREIKGGEVELRMQLTSLVEIQRWVMGWSGEARVIQPPELVRSVCKAGQLLEKKHK